MMGIVLTVHYCGIAGYGVPCPCYKHNEGLIDRMCSPIRVTASLTKAHHVMRRLLCLQ